MHRSAAERMENAFIIAMRTFGVISLVSLDKGRQVIARLPERRRLVDQQAVQSLLSNPLPL